MPPDHRIDDLFLIIDELILLEHGDPLLGVDGDITLIRLLLSGQDPEKGRFTRTIGADKAIAVAVGELDIDVFKNYALAIGKRNICCLEHVYIPVKAEGRERKKAARFVPGYTEDPPPETGRGYNGAENLL